MATFEEAAEKKRALSGQISTLVRTLSLGVLAVTWLFLSGGKDSPAMVAVVPKWVMLTIAAFCVAALAMDLIQYIAAYLQVGSDYAAAKKSKATKVTYYPSVVRERAFLIKTILAVAASVALVIVLFWAALSIPSPP